MKRALAVFLMLLWPAAAQACSVCFSATDGNRMAFIVTTVGLTLLPLAMFGGGLLWLRHRHQQLEREACEEVEPRTLTATSMTSRQSSWAPSQQSS